MDEYRIKTETTGVVLAHVRTAPERARQTLRDLIQGIVERHPICGNVTLEQLVGRNPDGSTWEQTGILSDIAEIDTVY